jgi:hypothetical protein
MKPTTVVTVGRFGSRLAKCGNQIIVPVWAIKVYEGRPRKTDGKWTYRLKWTVPGTARAGSRPSRSLVNKAKGYAFDNGYAFVAGVTYGDLVAR